MNLKVMDLKEYKGHLSGWGYIDDLYINFDFAVSVIEIRKSIIRRCNLRTM